MKFLVIFIPLIGAATGWLIITFSQMTLFWPVTPRRIPYTNLGFQGLLPQKQAALAATVGEMIEIQLRSAVTAEAGMAPDILSSLTCTVVDAVRERLDKRIPPLVPKGIKQKIIDMVEDNIRKEIPVVIETVADNFRSGQSCGNDLCCWIEEKIRRYDLSELEARIARSREIILLKVGAALIGFVSGIVQLLVVWLAQA